MVDPDRKINRLTDEHIEFLEKCDKIFSNRFKNSDTEFTAHCMKKSIIPPIIRKSLKRAASSSVKLNAKQRREIFQKQLIEKQQEFLMECVDEFDDRFKNSDYEFMQHCAKVVEKPPIMKVRAQPYHKNTRHYNGNWRGRQNNRHEPYQRRNINRDDGYKHKPMNIPKGYSNFVPASKH